ncbi:hypothetical protein [Paracoccus sp. SJTW-4]|uniref:hypothetical protein n=1 Tax=Paracoccus sp. SJTW-4 TaxID=3078428 RepID=UPI0039E87DD2
MKPIGGDPFAAQPYDRTVWDRLVSTLAAVKLGEPANGRNLLGEALAERMFPTADWVRYRDTDGREQRRAGGRGHEAVERWLLSRNLPRLRAIDGAQREGKVKRWRVAHLRIAEALEAFSRSPADAAAAQDAAHKLSCLPPDPALTGQPLLLPDPDRLTPERLLGTPSVDPAERSAVAAAAAALAVDCRRLVADVDDWCAENDTSRGRAAFARTVAAVVADLFDAAGAGHHVRFARQGQSDPARGPANAYCKAVAGALEALGIDREHWRRAAEDGSRRDRLRGQPLIRSAI